MRESAPLPVPSGASETVPGHYLFPGTLFAHACEHQVTTVLGSCVSVCLWDRQRRFGGINHYLLPYWNGEGLATPKYGNIAIPRLVEKLEELGSQRCHLVAKLFGGAAMWESSKGLLAIGERNMELAKQMLQELEIPVVSADLGGRTGRKLVFNTASGVVWLRRHQQVPPS